jgi:hypothetical protein
MIAAGLQYSRKKLLLVVATSRMVRYTAIGLLAVLYGQHIIRLGKQPAVQYAIVALAAISIGGSVLSLVRWFRKSRSVPG